MVQFHRRLRRLRQLLARARSLLRSAISGRSGEGSTDFVLLIVITVIVAAGMLFFGRMLFSAFTNVARQLGPQ